jgi:hypothetical protein
MGETLRQDRPRRWLGEQLYEMELIDFPESARVGFYTIELEVSAIFAPAFSPSATQQLNDLFVP